MDSHVSRQLRVYSSQISHSAQRGEHCCVYGSQTSQGPQSSHCSVSGLQTWQAPHSLVQVPSSQMEQGPQSTGSPMHSPSKQVSFSVQGLRSSHEMPLSGTSIVHCPVAGSQALPRQPVVKELQSTPATHTLLRQT